MPAKVNLVVAVGAPRADGYHDVATLLQAVSLFDRVSVEPHHSLRLVCRQPGVPLGADNLVWRAAEALARRLGRPPRARLTLRKGIPQAAGLGGGSADAAAALLACDLLWGGGLGREALAEVGAELGSDVPFFLWGGTARGSGRGERISGVKPFPAWPLLLAIPPGAAKVSTGARYAALDRLGVWPRPLLEAALAARTPGELAARLGNSFEALGRPELAVDGALGSLLCGSGPAIFALGPSGRWAGVAARQLRASGWWARACRFYQRGAEVVA